VAGGAEGVQIRSASRPLIFFNSTGAQVTQGWGIEVTNEGDTAGDFAIREDEKSGSLRFVIQNNTGNVGIGVLNPQSRLHVNSTTANVYIQFPVNSTALASADCNSEAQRGRMIVDGNNVRLHVCYGSGGWKTLTPA
jgi:hypothetical protein